MKRKWRKIKHSVRKRDEKMETAGEWNIDEKVIE